MLSNTLKFTGIKKNNIAYNSIRLTVIVAWLKYRPMLVHTLVKTQSSFKGYSYRTRKATCSYSAEISFVFWLQIQFVDIF